MRYKRSCRLTPAVAMLIAACSSESSGPTRPVPRPDAQWRSAMDRVEPKRNLEVILRGQGFGLVTFRQPKDDQKIIYLDTWVRGLAANTDYRLQRAVDMNVNGDCSSTAWLTLGEGLTPQVIATDDEGTGRAALWRDVSAIATGSAFDIHFRVIDAATSSVVLESDCYQYFVAE